jgi:lipopolysaccharide transport system permease protein
MLRHLLEIINPLPGLRVIFQNRNLLRRLVKRNISARYQGAFLGGLWNFIQPLMMLCVYTFVFSVVFKARWGEYAENSKGAFAMIIFCGMACFSVFSESVTLSSGIICSNANYVKKVVFPLVLLPLSQVLSSFLSGTVWLVLLLAGTVLIYGGISWSILCLPLLLIPFFMLTLGVAFFVSSLAVYIRDTPYVVNVILQVFFFLTPIFYPVSAVPETFRKFLLLNPLARMIGQIRDVLFAAKLPEWGSFGISFAGGIVVFLLGFAWFNKTQKGFADVI